MEELEALAEDDENAFSARCDALGVFTNRHTLEVDLFKGDGFTAHIVATLREHPWSTDRKAWIDEWDHDPETLDVEKYLSLIDTVGKGRFAQRLASRIAGIRSPSYIRRAIEYVVDRV